jgi:hypothetical protein
MAKAFKFARDGTARRAQQAKRIALLDDVHRPAKERAPLRHVDAGVARAGGCRVTRLHEALDFTFLILQRAAMQSRISLRSTPGYGAGRNSTHPISPVSGMQARHKNLLREKDRSPHGAQRNAGPPVPDCAFALRATADSLARNPP